MLKHYLGVYDPRTGELQVVPARELVVRSTLRSNIPLESEDVGEDAPPKTVRVILFAVVPMVLTTSYRLWRLAQSSAKLLAQRKHKKPFVRSPKMRLRPQPETPKRPLGRLL